MSQQSETADKISSEKLVQSSIDLDMTCYSSLFSENDSVNIKEKRSRFKNFIKDTSFESLALYRLNEQLSNSLNYTGLKRLCCICNKPSSMQKCSKIDCFNYFHLSCLSSHFPILFLGRVCPDHNKINKSQLKISYLSNSFNNNEELKILLKSQQNSSLRNPNFGKFFWFGISNQYFTKNESPTSLLNKNIKNLDSANSAET